MESVQNRKAELLASEKAMIEDTITYFRTHSFSYLIWGWALFTASVLHYSILQFGDDQLPFNASAVWPASIIAAALISVLKTVKNERGESAATYPAKTLSGIWKGFAGPVIIALMMGSVLGWEIAFPFVIASFGWGIISTGVAIQYKTMIWAGVSVFIFAVLAMYVAPDTQLLMITGAVTAGYLVPGYLMLYGKN